MKSIGRFILKANPYDEDEKEPKKPKISDLKEDEVSKENLEVASKNLYSNALQEPIKISSSSAADPLKISINETKTESSATNEILNEEDVSKENLEAGSLNISTESIEISIPETKPQSIATNEILKGVIIVISGIENPERARIRNLALQMGAKYRPDWTPDATHLITPFQNTPKHREQKSSGRGIAVIPSFIEKCFELKKKVDESPFLINPPPKRVIDLSDDDEDDDDLIILTSSNDQNHKTSVDTEKVVVTIDEENSKILNESQTSTFFAHLKVVLGNDLDEETKRKISEVIRDTVIEENDAAPDGFTVMISNKKRSEYENPPDYPIVLPDWVYECSKQKKLVEMIDYV